MNPQLDEDSDEELESKEWEQRYSGKSGFIFLIDARKPMFEGGRESYFRKSFECCYKATLQIAREQRYDFVSIVLFGTAKSEGKFAPPGVVLLQPLCAPTVDMIKKTKEFIDGQFEDILTKYGHGQSISLREILIYSKNLLHFCKTKLYTKSIVLFTFDDDPHKNDLVSAHKARKCAEDIRLQQIEFDVVGLGSFDSNLFYKELVLTSRGELLKDWHGKDPIKKIEDVQSEIASISKKFNRRVGMFYLGDEAKIRVLFYKLYHEPQKLVWVSKDPQSLVQESVKAETSETDRGDPLIEEIKKEDDGKADQLDPYNQETQEWNEKQAKNAEDSNSNSKRIVKEEMEDTKSIVSEESKNKKDVMCPNIGGVFIPMTKKELKWYEAKVPKGLSLIGFRSLFDIPKHCVLGEPYFVVPDSRDQAGERFFSTLLHGCLKRGVAPVCWFSLTISGSPSLAVLYPTEPSEYAKGKIHPHGFHLIKIPFADMITEHTLDDLPEVESSEIQAEAANGIVKKTSLNWYPDSFHDYAYRARIAMIEAIAMEYEDVEEVLDDTDIDVESISERLGRLSEGFTDCSHLPAEVLGKRGGGNANHEGSRPKEQRVEDTTSLISRIKAGEGNKLTVAQLRELLRGEGVRSLSALTKPRLVALANERFAPEHL